MEDQIGRATAPFAEICHPKKRAFLTAYARTGNTRTGNKSLAARIVGIAKQTIYTRQWRKDEQFQDALTQAREMAADSLEGEAFRPAVEGVEEPVGWYKGEAGGTIRRYSDTLLIFLMKGLMPERYGNRREFRGSLANLDISKLPDALVARIAAGEHPLAVLASAAPSVLEPGETGHPPPRGANFKAAVYPHPAFLDALTRAREASLAWWEAQGLKGI